MHVRGHMWVCVRCTSGVEYRACECVDVCVLLVAVELLCGSELAVRVRVRVLYVPGVVGCYSGHINATAAGHL
jgi:hypothetical protein